jgi:hypothetical protein
MKKNILYKLINSEYLVTTLYLIGMLGTLIASVYHVFFEKNNLGITPSIIVAAVSLLFILVAVIFAKLSTVQDKFSNKISYIIFITIVIIFILIFLVLFS